MDTRPEQKQRIGIIGGGQLGRMLALAAYPFGARVTFLDPAPDAPMSHVANQICGAYDDARALEQLARASDVVTYEFENVPVESAELISQFTKIFPPPGALRVSQDRFIEKTFLNSLKIPTPKFARVDSLNDLENAISEIGFPVVLKTRRLGYDGKGQVILQGREESERAWQELKGNSMILEQFVDFTRELSILAVRGQEGICGFYPLVENHHREGILRLSLAPAPNPTRKLQELAQAYAQRVLDALNYVGVLAIEFFQAGGALLANEMAPRVHNSGHWTIEGAVTSQFENHARAVELAIGFDASARLERDMFNLIGDLPAENALYQIPDAHIHLYDKAPRPGRKLGHVTIVAHDEKTRNQRLKSISKSRIGFQL